MEDVSTTIEVAWFNTESPNKTTYLQGPQNVAMYLYLDEVTWTTLQWWRWNKLHQLKTDGYETTGVCVCVCAHACMCVWVAGKCTTGCCNQSIYTQHRNGYSLIHDISMNMCMPSVWAASSGDGDVSLNNVMNDFSNSFRQSWCLPLQHDAT